ncbi:hypothetical protein D8S78_18615 [Natrialba swarupiae]|nr:hypothetical protein [Natrialba swarupiae]
MDLAVVATGVLSIGIAAVFALLYVRSRSRRLVIEVRGDDDVELPVTGADDVGTAVVELEEAIRPEPRSVPSGPTGSDRDRLEGIRRWTIATERSGNTATARRTYFTRSRLERTEIAGRQSTGTWFAERRPAGTWLARVGESADGRGPTAEFPESADPTSLEPEVPLSTKRTPVPPVSMTRVDRRLRLGPRGIWLGGEERARAKLETERWWTGRERREKW